MNRRVAFAVLMTLAALALAWTIAIWTSGGFTIALGGARISAMTPTRPLVVAAVLLAGAFALLGAGGSVDALRAFATRLTPGHGALALALATTIVSLAGNSWTASGPDSFAYVSQAALWRHHQLDVPVPLAADAPWPNAVASFAPFGYRAAAHGAAALVPITAPGVPMLMAVLQTIAGSCAAYLVTPAAGGALVLFVYLVGCRIRSPAAGLVAAWLVATSPAVLFMLMWPMTDIPAAAVSALLLLMLLRPGAAAGVSAGLVASAGVLTRPNFVLIAAAAGVWLLFDAALARDARGRWLRAAGFGLALIPGLAIVAWLNARWFGSPLASGYGTPAGLLSFGRIATNVGHYGRWLVESSPFALLGLGALVITRRLWRDPFGFQVRALLIAIILSVVSVYLIYEPYQDWWYLRFLLPAWPAIFAATGAAVDALRTRGRLVTIVATIVVVLAGVDGVVEAQSRGVFAIGSTERRYATIARLVETSTEPSAVILTSQHSGTVRYYAGRETLRYDLLDPAWLDRAIAWLETRGRHPYILIEDWELPIFEQRFGATSAIGHLPFAPALAWQSAHVRGWVWLYDPLRRDAPTVQPSADFERAQPWCAHPAR